MWNVENSEFTLQWPKLWEVWNALSYRRDLWGLSQKIGRLKRPKLFRVWDISHCCETSQTLKRRLKRPKLGDVWNVFSYRRDLCLPKINHSPSVHPMSMSWHDFEYTEGQLFLLTNGAFLPASSPVLSCSILPPPFLFSSFSAILNKFILESMSHDLFWGCMGCVANQMLDNHTKSWDHLSSKKSCKIKTAGDFEFER